MMHGAAFCATDMLLVSAGTSAMDASGIGTNLRIENVEFQQGSGSSPPFGGAVVVKDGARMQAKRCHFKNTGAQVKLPSEVFVHNCFVCSLAEHWLQPVSRRK